MAEAPSSTVLSLEARAFHEAGHAVAALFFGQRVAYVTIRAHPETIGGIAGETLGHLALDSRDVKRAATRRWIDGRAVASAPLSELS
jgi:hypothetical protein